MRERVTAVVVGWSLTILCTVLSVLLASGVLSDVLGLLAMLAGLSVLLITALVGAELLSHVASAPPRHKTGSEPIGKNTPSDRPTRHDA